MRPDLRVQSARTSGIENVAAWSLVALIHFLLAWMATRPSMPIAPAGRSMEITYVELRPPIRSLALPSMTPTGQAGRPTRRAQLQAQAVTRPSSPTDSPASTVQSDVADDRWQVIERAHKDEGIQFARNKLTDRYNPIQAGPPGRFHMRPPPSPAEFVRAVSKELFWPPGYTDDPCGGLDKAVQMLRDGSSPREHELLRDAVAQQDQYCRKG